VLTPLKAPHGDTHGCGSGASQEEKAPGGGWERAGTGTEESPLFSSNDTVVQNKSAFPTPIHHLNALCDHK